MLIFEICTSRFLWNEFKPGLKFKSLWHNTYEPRLATVCADNGWFTLVHDSSSGEENAEREFSGAEAVYTRFLLPITLGEDTLGYDKSPKQVELTLLFFMGGGGGKEGRGEKP